MNSSPSCGRTRQPKSATSLLFARKGKARSIGLSSRSNDMEGHFYGQCKNENLVRGLSELKKFDAVQKSAAMLIQLVWRERIRRRGGGADVQKKSQGHTCYAVDAPAYFGESSLWTPYSTWTTRAAIHEYTIRVKSQVEVVNIPRLAIAVCIEKFSPWLRNRFEVFQAAVLHDRDFLADKESQVSTKPSSLALIQGSICHQHSQFVLKLGGCLGSNICTYFVSCGCCLRLILGRNDENTVQGQRGPKRGFPTLRCDAPGGGWRCDAATLRRSGGRVALRRCDAARGR